MGADDQNVEAGITGTGSGGPPATMRAVVLDAPGPPSALAIRELPVPVPSAGQVLIRVRARERIDLPNYLAIVAELGARSVLDVGCGTGNRARPTGPR